MADPAKWRRYDRIRIHNTGKMLSGVLAEVWSNLVYATWISIIRQNEKELKAVFQQSELF